MRIKERLLLTPKDIKPSHQGWKVEGVINPAAIRHKIGKIILLVRIAEHHVHKGKMMHCPVIVSSDETKMEKISKKQILAHSGNVIFLKNGMCRLSTFSHLRKVILDEDGFEIEHIGENPFFTGNSHEGQYGVEDPRITKIDNKYLMTYVTISINEGVSTSLAVSADLNKWKRKGIIFREQNKDAVIFPEKINGKYVALHRPEGYFEFNKPSIWISYSKDLIYWGKEKSIIQPREKAWDNERIGSGCPPIKIKEGWLEIYHGVNKKGNRKTYNAGAILLDKKNPEKILARSPRKEPLFEPEASWEKNGFVNDVIFPTGIIHDKNDLLIYHGAADSNTSVKKVKLKDILDHMEWGKK